MKFKVAFIGAGSIGFTRRLVEDILSVPEFRAVRLAFTDIDKRNLEMVYERCALDIRANGLEAELTATLDRREALRDAKYVFCVARIGGLSPFRSDIEIPLRYGVDQCVGDTLCAGGIMYAQRGIPALLDFCRDIRDVAAPGCLLFNYANPMAMMTWAGNRYGDVRTIGLCHGVQGGHRKIADVLGLKKEEVDIVAAGINHQTWFIRVAHKGKDLTGRLLQAFERHPEYSRAEKVRIDMMRRFGYFSTESNGHLSEYLPWYRKRPDEIRKWIDMRAWNRGETGGFLRVCLEQRELFETDFATWMKQPAPEYAASGRSHEHGSHIIESLETGRVYRGHFNVPNGGIITNLPPDAIVEVPGYVDRTGINTPVVGDLPLGCAAVCNASINVQRLAVAAAVGGDDRLLRQAMMMDPLVGAVCNPPEIWQMVDELLAAQARWLPQYAKAVREARKRLKNGARIPAKSYAGAARLKVRTGAELRRASA
ncbi:MAG: alpha-glucosidase/alpha-galactosidase [Kiritimatiellae bacterium]|nr:alpha-glucosidase/alpha-galactosidase [Kiritimatiellia bacterium]